MKVLIACEYSGAVRDAFIAAGHDAMSCDLLPTDAPGPHHQGNVLEILGDGWDLMIAHPPCTYLSVSGMHWTSRGLRDPQLTEDALAFVRTLMEADIPKIAVENPISVISSRIRKPDQIIQPWWFGNDASKKTCLWLKGLPKLVPDFNSIIEPKGWGLVRFAAEMQECDQCGKPYCERCYSHFGECKCFGSTMDDVIYKQQDGILFGAYESVPMRWGNQTASGQNKLGPSDDRWKLRSATYPGIAAAFAAQWGNQKQKEAA